MDKKNLELLVIEARKNLSETKLEKKTFTKELIKYVVSILEKIDIKYKIYNIKTSEGYEHTLMEIGEFIIDPSITNFVPKSDRFVYEPGEDYPLGINTIEPIEKDYLCR